MSKLDVWTPSFEVPQELYARAAEFRIEEAGGKHDGIPSSRNYIWNGHEREMIVVDGYCLWHDDKHLSVRYTVLVVLRNDLNSWVEVKGQPRQNWQPKGSMVKLDIYCKHRVNAPGGRFCKPGVWVGLILDSVEDHPRAEWERRFQEMLFGEEKIQNFGDGSSELCI